MSAVEVKWKPLNGTKVSRGENEMFKYQKLKNTESVIYKRDEVELKLTAVLQQWELIKAWKLKQTLHYSDENQLQQTN